MRCGVQRRWTAAALLAVAAVSTTAWAEEDDCTQASRFIYVMTAQRELHRFHPQRGSFEKVGTLDCGTRPNIRPYSMAVGRDGTAWVVMSDGSLYTASTRDARCAATGFRTGQSGFTTFGMGFARDTATQTDHLYVSNASRIGGVGHKLAELDTTTLTLRDIGVYQELSARAELTGTADGHLFGAFEGTPFVIAEIDPASARIRSQAPQSGVNFAHNSANFAFAFWGGDFYLFVGPGSTTEVYRYDPDTRSTTHLSGTRLTIVGAGVSTCAPVELPTEDFTQLQQIAPPPSTPPPTPPAPTPPPQRAAEIAAIAPGPHPPGEDLTVVAGVRDDSGGFVPLDGGTFHVTDSAGGTLDYPGTPRPDGQVEAHIPLTAAGEVQIGFTPSAASGAGATTAPARVEVGWGLTVDLSGLPAACLVGQPCQGTARLVAQGTAAQTLLQDPRTRWVLEENGAPVLAEPLPADLAALSVTRTHGAPGPVRWQIRIRGPAGETVSAEHTVAVREPLVLRAPAALDLGARTAGEPTAASCQMLDLSASTGRGGHLLDLSAEGLAGCLSAPQVRLDGGTPRALPLSVPADAASLEVCLAVPFCAPDAAPDGARLVITPQDAAFADQRAEVGLRWTVAGRSWLACNGIWVWPTLGGLAALLVVVGFVRPRRFPLGASVRLAGSVKGLKRATATELRTCSGGAPGFYRDACLGIHGDGSVNGRTRGAVALLRATRQGVMLEPRGGLEVYDRRRQSWGTPEKTGSSRLFEPSPSETYRIGELYFQIETG